MDHKNNIFSLKHSQDELSVSHNNVTFNEYREIVPSRDVSGSNFGNGPIYYKFGINADEWAVLNKSYFRFVFEVTRGNGFPLTLTNSVGLSMNAASTLFQSIDFMLNEDTLASIPSYVAQTDTLLKRISQSKAKLDSFENINFMSPDLMTRINAISSDGKQIVPTVSITNKKELGYDNASTFQIADNSDFILFSQLTDGIWKYGDIFIHEIGNDPTMRREYTVTNVSANGLVLNVQGYKTHAVVVTTDNFYRKRTEISNRNLFKFEMCWKPSLSLFNLDHALPTGQYQIKLQPFQEYAKRFIESLSDKKVGITDNDININITDMFFYVNVIKGPRVNDTAYFIDMDNVQIQRKPIKTNNSTQTQFSIRPSTSAVAIFFQDNRAESATDSRVSPTIFKCYQNDLDDKDENTRIKQVDQSLHQFYINYGAYNFPRKYNDMTFTSGTDTTLQRYVESMLENGSYIDNPESLSDFQNRGRYYFFNLPKQDTRETNLVINTTFTANNFGNNVNVCVAEFFKTIARVEIDKTGKAKLTNMQNE